MTSNEFPAQTTPNFGPATLERSLPLDERLRSLMRRAPDYQDDSAARGEFMTNYRFGSYAPTPDTPGLVITEEIIPVQELLGKDNQRDYSMVPSSTMEQYMYANSFASLTEKSIGQALAGAGFTGTRLKTDSRGSQLISATFPSIDSYNQTMQAFDPASFLLELAEPKDVYDARRVTEALAQGRLLTTGSQSHMLCNISMLSLLAPEVLQSLQRNAIFALDESAKPVQEASASTQQGQMFSLRSRIGGIQTVIFSRNLIDAVSDPYDGQVSPTAIESLGYELANLVEYENTKPADYGLELAEKTVARIQALSAKV